MCVCVCVCVCDLKVFLKGTATTRLVLPGFVGSQRQEDVPTPRNDQGQHARRGPEALPRRPATSRKPPVGDHRGRHSAVASPVYDAVFVEQPSTICSSTLELTAGRIRAEDIGKALSLQDLKVPDTYMTTKYSRYLTRQSNSSEGAATHLLPKSNQ